MRGVFRREIHEVTSPIRQPVQRANLFVWHAEQLSTLFSVSFDHFDDCRVFACLGYSNSELFPVRRPGQNARKRPAIVIRPVVAVLRKQDSVLCVVWIGFDDTPMTLLGTV